LATDNAILNQTDMSNLSFVLQYCSTKLLLEYTVLQYTSVLNFIPNAP
jgi:hypothetical protein